MNHWLSLQAILTAYTKEIHDPSGQQCGPGQETDMQVTDVLAASHKTIAMLQNHHMELGKLLLGEEASSC